MIPVVQAVTPSIGPTSGGDLVRVVGLGFTDLLDVRFGDVPAMVLSVREEAGLHIAELRSPEHGEDLVGVHLQNLDAVGEPIIGELVTVADAYRFLRPRIIEESTLTRLVRRLLRMLKVQILENTSLTVSVDYDDTPDDAVRVVALASLPSLVLSGPTLSPNRFYATNVPHQDVVAGVVGPELLRRRPSCTVDLAFALTAASERTAELLNLMAAVATFFNTNKWIALLRDAAVPALGTVRWEMETTSDYRTNLRGRGDVRVFTVGLVIRGFDIDEGLPLDRSKAVSDSPLISTNPISEQEPTS